MKQSINIYQFRDAFQSMRPDSFSYNGLELLFDYLEQIEEDTLQELELDVIALCGDFNESSIDEIIENYGIDVTSAETDEEREEIVTEYLQENTSFIGITPEGSIVYQAF